MSSNDDFRLLTEDGALGLAGYSVEPTEKEVEVNKEDDKK